MVLYEQTWLNQHSSVVIYVQEPETGCCRCYHLFSLLKNATCIMCVLSLWTGGQRGISCRLVRGHQLVRYPRKTCDDHAERHPAGSSYPRRAGLDTVATVHADTEAAFSGLVLDWRDTHFRRTLSFDIVIYFYLIFCMELYRNCWQTGVLVADKELTSSWARVHLWNTAVELRNCHKRDTPLLGRPCSMDLIKQ